MPHQDPVDTPSFSLSEIRERMKEKKNGTLKTMKTSTSIAAKIKTKAINNSSIIKATLKQNNKALAVALNAAKREAQELTKEKMLLQKEVKLGNFERACLRHKLSAVVNLFVRVYHKHNEYIEELQQFMNSQLHAVVELNSPSEKDSCSLSPFDGRLSATGMADNQADDNCPVRTAPKAMRILLIQEGDDKCENGRSDLASTSQPVLPLQLPASAVGEPLKNVANPAVKKPSSSCLMDEPLKNSERNGQPSGEMDGTALALDFGAIFGGIDRSWTELPDNGPLMLPKEISQMGEFVTLQAQNKRSKINASKAEALKNMSTGTKGRVSSTSKSEGNVDNCNEGADPNTSQPKALGVNTMSTKVSAQGDHLEKIQPWNSRGQNKGRNSQCFSNSVGPSTIHVVSPYHVHNLSFFENSGSRVKRTSQHSDKTGGCEKISVVDLALWKGETSIQKPNNKTDMLKYDPLNQCQILESFSLLGSPPSAVPILLDDAFSDGEHRKWFKMIPKVQGSSTIQNTTLLKTSSGSLEKTKENRKVHTGNVKDLSLDSHQTTPARSCALPETSAVVNKKDAKQAPSGRWETMQETHKEPSPMAAPQLNENKIPKDLTNQSLCHSTHLEEPLIRRTTRARKAVTYEEPKLNRKLRRGDPFASSDFFSCPIYKTRKKKITKSEAISNESSSNPVP
ncbi:UNVERIFIED_CONTAM: hypothetical protein K2H54_047733 [Gekko kuhli]